MGGLVERLDALDRGIAGWMERYGRWLLRWALGIIFIWFGALKVAGIIAVEILLFGHLTHSNTSKTYMSTTSYERKAPRAR